jgi:hypothetical protein
MEGRKGGKKENSWKERREGRKEGGRKEGRKRKVVKIREQQAR